MRANRGNVTTLQFLKHSCLLASGADTSGSVKLWDVRMLKDPVSFMPASLPESEHPPQLNIVPFNSDLTVKASSAVVHLSSDPEGVSLDPVHLCRAQPQAPLPVVSFHAGCSHSQGDHTCKMYTCTLDGRGEPRYTQNEVPGLLVLVAGQWLAVLRRNSTLQLYDTLRIDCGIPAVQQLEVPDGITFKSSTAFSAAGDRIAVTSASGSTYLYPVCQPDLLLCDSHSLQTFEGELCCDAQTCMSRLKRAGQ